MQQVSAVAAANTHLFRDGARDVGVAARMLDLGSFGSEVPSSECERDVHS